MKNRLIYFIFLFTLSISGKAQTWLPVGSGISGIDINTTWALCTYDSMLFAGGWFNNAGGITANDIAQWNGIQWDSIGAGTNGYINAMVVYNGHLYAGGQFTEIGGITAYDIAMWNGTKWMSVGTGIKGGDYGVYALSVYNGKLYAGGSFDTAGSKAIFALAQWNDTNWSAIGTGVSSSDEDDGVFAFAVYKNVLYIGGDFVIGASNNIAQWNDTNLSGVGGGTVGSVYSLAVYNNLLYVGGMISLAGPVEANCIATWNSTAWSSLDSAGITGENGWASVNAMAVYRGALYVGGFFDTVNGKPVNCITKWNGANWSSLGSGVNSGGSIDAMDVFNNSLYVGGGFDSAGGVYAKNIAMLTGSTGVDELGKNSKVIIYPNPASSILSIDVSGFGDGKFYIIYNELGQQVETGKMNSSNISTIDVSAYASGIYFVTISDDNTRYSTKFIKKLIMLL